MVSITLHTSSIPPGACFHSPQEGQVPILLLLLSLTVIIHTHPSMSEQPYPSCSGTQMKNQTAITPGHQSLDAKPQQPWPHYSHKWDHTTIKIGLFFACSMNESIRYQLPLYHHNLVEMWLNRLTMNPRFSISSKNDFNGARCSASSLEDNCDTIVFTCILDLVP